MRNLLIPLICSMILFASCAPVQDRRTLNDMEALMPERPDSALAVLRGLQPRDLPGLHVRPLHALLLSEALDKNYIDLTDDSLALAANRWYGDHGTKLHRLKSWYYLGRIHFNSGNYAEAVICYDKALEYAESLTNYHYMGLINREIASSYSAVGDDYHGAGFMRKSIDSFRSAEEDNYVAYSLLALARLFYRQMKYDDCVSVLDELESFSDNRYILARVSEQRALNAISSGSTDYEKIKSDFRSAGIGTTLPPAVTQYVRIAYVFQKSGQPDSADYYLQRAEKLLVTKSDTLVFDFERYKIERDRGNYLLASSLLEKAVHSQDSSVYAALRQSVSFYQGNYYQNASRVNALKVRMRSMHYGILVLFILAIALFFRSRYRKQKALTIEEMAKTDEILNDLELMRTEKQEMGRIVATLFENRINILETLSEQYEMVDESHQRKMREKGRELSRDEIVASFRETMRDMRKDKDITISLEDTLNIWKDGIMEKLRYVFGNDSSSKIKMTDEDFKFAPFYFSGLKQKTISYLTGYSEPAIKERKYRMKMKIEALDDSFSEEKALFLSNL